MPYLWQALSTTHQRQNINNNNNTFCEFLMACAITAVAQRMHVTIIIFIVGFAY